MTDDERTITFQELVWEDIGWAKLTEPQKIEWIEQRLAKDGAGTLEPPLGDGNRKSLLGLYAKLKGDKKQMDVTHTHLVQELTDAELERRINQLLGIAGKTQPPGIASGESAAPSTAKAH